MNTQVNTPVNTPVNPEPISDHWSQIRTEGQHRTHRIFQIFQSAFAETTTELQGGFRTIRPLTQHLKNSVVDDLKERGQTAASQVNQAWTDQTDHPDIFARLKTLITTLLGDRPAQWQAQVCQKVTEVDAVAARNYGERYQATKRTVTLLKNWSADLARSLSTEATAGTPSPATAGEVTTVEAKVIEIEVP